jgi:surface antigen
VRGVLLAFVALMAAGLSGCSGGSQVTQPLAGTPQSAAVAPTQPAAPVIPTGAALGGILGGPVGAGLGDEDRTAAWNAQTAALDSGQRRSWRGSHGVFGFVEPGAETGEGCRAYSQTIYIAGRPNRGRGVGCKQPDGSWKMTS